MVTLNEQDDELQELVAVQVTTVVPAAKVEPEEGEQVTIPDPDEVGSVQVAT